MPLILIDQQERIEAINAPAVALFGSATEGRHYITVLRQPLMIDCIEKALKQRLEARTRFTRPDQESAESYRVYAAPVNSESGSGVLVSFEDVTDLQRAEQMRRDFVANVSHELKTPLTALLSFIETLKGAARDDEIARERFLGIMEREAERMNRLVADLLSLSRVETDERVRPTERVDLRNLIQSTATAIRPMAEDAGVEIAIMGDMDHDLTVPGDADQLVQVFTNLMENAIKYGGGGGVVTVALSRQDRAPGFKDGFVQVDVIDQGDGFDPVHIPRLTERFYRVDSHRSRELGGTGLGLAIAKHILNRHRGRFRIESAPGRGARFSVLLPLGS
nr:ATP-binding protein [Actibacterium sp. 188UL27-1]